MMFNISRLQAGMLALLLPIPVIAAAQSAMPSAMSGTQTPQPDMESAQSGMTLQQFEARQEKRLMAADTDGDGKVSKAEFIAAAKSGPRSGNGDPARRFDKLDLNGDGMLDKSEIDAMLERRFKRLDTNGDGVVSPQERAAARKMAGQGKPDS